MKVLVFGGSGFIGSKLVELLSGMHETHFTYNNNLFRIVKAVPHPVNITDKDAVTNLVKSIEPDVVFHAVAITNVDLCETDRHLADAVNVEGTRNVANACKETNSKMVYISTSFVFDGKKGIYFEDDETNPINYYGLTKLEGEKITMDTGDYLVLRTDQPYGFNKPWQKQNTVTRVLAALNKNEKANEIIDWYNNPTYVDNFAEVSIKLLKKSGTYHVTGSDFLSRYGWALKICEVFGKDKNLVVPVTSDTLNLPVKRPNARLDNSKAQKDSGMKLLGVEAALKDMKQKIGYTL